jgi:membrane protein DedA with SNARE-associated domain
MLLETAAFPVPSEILLPFVGYLVSERIFSFWPIVIYSTVAALLGSFIDYYLGLRLGSRFLTESSSLPWGSTGHLRRVQYCSIVMEQLPWLFSGSFLPQESSSHFLLARAE